MLPENGRDPVEETKENHQGKPWMAAGPCAHSLSGEKHPPEYGQQRARTNHLMGIFFQANLGSQVTATGPALLLHYCPACSHAACFSLTVFKF